MVEYTINKESKIGDYNPVTRNCRLSIRDMCSTCVFFKSGWVYFQGPKKAAEKWLEDAKLRALNNELPYERQLAAYLKEIV